MTVSPAKHVLLRLLCVAVAAIVVVNAAQGGGLFAATHEGNQLRGVVTDVIVNFFLYIVGSGLCAGFRMDAQEASATVVILSLLGEIINFFMDNGLKANRVLYYLQGKKPPPCNGKDLYTENTSGFAYLIDLLLLLGTDVGFRSFVVMMFNFMLAVQFEGAISNLLSDAEPPPTLMITVWWAVTLLCSTAINIVRFGWAYRQVTTTVSQGAMISTETVLLMILIISVQFMTNPYVSMSSTPRILLVVFIMIMGLVGTSLGALTVRSCATYQEESMPRKVGQAFIFSLALFALLVASVATMREGSRSKMAAAADAAMLERSRSKMA